MSLIGEVAWILIKKVVRQAIAAGASVQDIYVAVGHKIEKLNYVGDATDIRIILERVAHEIANIVPTAYHFI